MKIYFLNGFLYLLIALGIALTRSTDWSLILIIFAGLLSILPRKCGHGRLCQSASGICWPYLHVKCPVCGSEPI